jgi:hypothetical protein
MDKLEMLWRMLTFLKCQLRLCVTSA